MGSFVASSSPLSRVYRTSLIIDITNNRNLHSGYIPTEPQWESAHPFPIIISAPALFYRTGAVHNVTGECTMF